MLLRRHSPITFRRLVLTGVLGLCSLHCGSAAGTLSAGSECGVPGSTTGECRDGLVCMLETPGSQSEICVCTDLQLNHTSCDTVRCPPVLCDCDQLYVPQGECCPSCLPPLTGGCTMDNASYSEGDSWQLSVCVTCTCRDGQPVCDSIECETPECSNAVVYPDQCCPMCPAVITHVVLHKPVKLTCEYNSEVYQDGERWNRSGDPCTTCFCENGTTLCASQHCLVECDDAIYLEHICCPICPDAVSFSLVLELDYDQYLKEEITFRARLEAALRDVGVNFVDIKATKFGHHQTQITITVSSSTFKEAELLLALLDQLKSPLVASVKGGDSEKQTSITESSSTDVQSSAQRQGFGETALIITVTASIAVAVVTAIIFAVIIVGAWRKRGFSKTVTV